MKIFNILHSLRMSHFCLDAFRLAPASSHVDENANILAAGQNGYNNTAIFSSLCLSQKTDSSSAEQLITRYWRQGRYSQPFILLLTYDWAQ
jgi:hypothetical protein